MWQLKTKRQVTCECELSSSTPSKRQKSGENMHSLFQFNDCIFIYGMRFLLFSVYYRFSYQIKSKLTVKFGALSIKLDDIFCHQNVTFTLVDDFHIMWWWFQLHNFCLKFCNIFYRSLESDCSFRIDGIANT